MFALYLNQETDRSKSINAVSIMNNSFFQRRQFLLFGLGAAGAGVAAALWPRKWPAQSGEVAIKTSFPVAPVATQPQESTSARLLPEFQGIQQWLNSDPLTRKDLQGSVVLLQFWTLGCINCQRTLPYITRWHQQYAAQGLKVIGVHTPEFPCERQVGNIQAAIERHHITYPVAVDNNFQTWQAYRNEYWPHLFLADRQGLIRYDHIGEGAYTETANTIEKLLKL
jgi:thiol-disulfide isomerase/thioredoxin